MQNLYVLKAEAFSDDIINDLKIASDSLNSKKDKDLYIATRLLEKYILNGREKHIDANNKPYAIEGSRYNLSQVGEYACAYESTDGEVGVDIAIIKEYDKHFIERIFSEDERRSLTSGEDVTKAWTIKEALIKCVGVGLKGLNDAKIDSDCICSYKTEQFNYKCFVYKNYIITCVSKNKISIQAPKELKLDDLFIK
ncbi:MAG: 4'-phosphopantetheinyl transferase superfamily protein [Clostridia bacterium]|nr:4'-phosphopantetheinyl transferase superfamily protein [Clostridia bacterium]